MTIKGSGRRVLRFAVTGALLGGASCDSAKDGTTSPADSKSDAGDSKTGEAKAGDGKAGPPEYAVNPGPEPVAVERVNTVKEPEPVELVEPDNVNTQKVEDPEPIEPDNVNTQKVEEPKELKEPKHVNTRKVEEPKEPPKKVPPMKTNTGRVPDPKGP